VQHTDQQWFVRSAAQDVLALGQEPGGRAPKPYSQPEVTVRLIAWAAQQGLSVPPGRGAVEVLKRALQEGGEGTPRAAAHAPGRLGEPEAARSLYPPLREKSETLRDTAFGAFARIAASTAQRLAAPTV
jgi:HEAT repeat protein